MNTISKNKQDYNEEIPEHNCDANSARINIVLLKKLEQCDKNPIKVSNSNLGRSMAMFQILHKIISKIQNKDLIKILGNIALHGNYIRVIYNLC